MADNFVPNTSGTFTFASDDVAAVHWPYSKIAFGADGTVTRVSAADPLPVTVATTSIAKAEDVAHATGDVGVMALAVRQDAATALAAAGDYIPLIVDANGALHVKAAGNSGTVIGDVNVVTAPADDRTVDSTSAALATDALMNDQTVLTPRFAAISAAASGNNTLVAAVTGKKIRVTNVVLVSAGSVNVTFQSGAGGTALTGAIPLAANTGFAPGFDPTGHFETASGALLNLNLSAAVSVAGWLKYVEV